MRQLDAGCEALHFGQIRIMDDRDPGHRAIWSLLQRVRRYARTRNRGFVLCGATPTANTTTPYPPPRGPTRCASCCSTFTRARCGPTKWTPCAPAPTAPPSTTATPATWPGPFMG
ncbi:MAG: hypothetical protein WKG07_22540 [Hymenobacter sp.]